MQYTEHRCLDIGIFVDEWGPEKIVYVNDPANGMSGVIVIDNTVLGPGKGGIRFVPDVDTQEVIRLARAMTWKTALAELPFGGAKSGIRGTPEKKEAFVKSFAKAMKNLAAEYIAAPDMGIGEKETGIIAEIAGKNAVTGKPANMGGLPHELGSTGFGVAEATDVAVKYANLDLGESRVAIEGFGNVGMFAAKFLDEKGAKIVAVSDSKGTIYNPDGLDIKELAEVKQKTGCVQSYKNGEKLPTSRLFELPVEILIPGARPDVINESNVSRIKAKLIVEAANIPMSKEMEHRVRERGIVVVPDIIANAGGVISSYVEYTGGTEDEMFKIVKEKIRRNVDEVLRSCRRGGSVKDVAIEIAQERIRKAREKI